MNFNNYTIKAQEAVQKAADVAKESGQQAIETGHLLKAMLETTEEDLMNTVFPHPTLSEMMHESVLDAYDRVIHM